MTFQAIYSLLLIDIILIIILRSYRDVRSSGADDPIAVEIRKLVLSSLRIWRSLLVKIFSKPFNTRISQEPSDLHEIFEPHGASQDHIHAVPRKRLSDMTKEDYQQQMLHLTQSLEVLTGEIHYLTERLFDVSKTQQELVRINTSLGTDHSCKQDTNEKHLSEVLGVGDEVVGHLSRYSLLISDWQHTAEENDIL